MGCSMSSRWVSTHLIPSSTRRSGEGVRVAAPTVNLSAVLCQVERDVGGLQVRIGLGYVKGVREEEMRRLETERERGGPYRGIADLASRSGAGRDGLERLAWAGALDALPLTEPGEAGHRRQRYWQLGIAGTSQTQGDATQLALPMEPPSSPALRALGSWEESVENYRSTGINLREHPLGLLRPSLRGKVSRSCDLEKVADGETVEVAGMVIARQRPETAKGITFMLLEDERGTVNLIVGKAAYERSRSVVRAAPLVRARGRLERREGAANVIVAEICAVGDSLGAEASLTTEKLTNKLRAAAPMAHSFGRR